MIFRGFLFFFFLTSQLWAKPLLMPEDQLTLPAELYTLREIGPVSAQYLLQEKQFEKGLYNESQGFSDNAYWHKLEFPITPVGIDSNAIYLGMNFYVIDHLDFYLFHGNQLQNHWKRGALQNWNNNAAHYKGIWIPISLSSQHTTTLLIRKQGNSPLLTPIHLFNEEDAITQQEQRMLFWAFIISGLFILLVHNVFVFVLLRQPGFVYYLGLNIVLFISLSIITGFNRWIFPEAISQWTVSNIFVIFGMAAWILYRFSLHFLKEIQIPHPRSFIRRYGDWAFILFLLSTQLVAVKTSALFFATIEAFIFASCTYWGIKAYKKGFIAARFYLFSWLILMLGSILNTCIYWELLPINFATESLLPISAIIQLLGFSFAFADKANHIEHNRQLEAVTDIRTGLPNRSYYFDHLPIQLNKVKQQHPELVLIMIDIASHLKLSQAFGPATADEALCEIMSSINEKTSQMDGFLSFPLPNKALKKSIRLNTKNIVLISTTPSSLTKQIQQIQQLLEQPTLVNKIHFRHQYKIGSALYPTQGESLDKLYQNAMVASNSVLYSSGNWVPFTHQLKSNHAHQLHLITLLTDDIEHGKLYFDIQPQVNLVERNIVGGEVLIRWRNEHIGQVSPVEFIPLAEQTGLIYKLTDMLLKKIFKWASTHPEALLTQSLSINISALDLLQEDFAKRTTLLLKQYELPAEKFTIEITETSVFENSDIVGNNVKELHKAGFKLAIDDFGVGYSSMQNLVSLNTNELKIDRFFVINLLVDTQSQILCRSMIDLSKELNIVSVAEGIESEEILTLLKKWHCQVGQGYHLHRPMPPENYLSLLEESNTHLSSPINNA